MSAPVTLPRLSWGDARGPAVLLAHGLGSDAALMWRLGTALADAGWHAVAVDLRGHGDAPRTLDYSLAAYAADLAATRPDDGGAWDAVVGHSLGGAAATIAAAADAAWTRRLVLVDPAIHLSDRDRDTVRASQEQSFADPSIAAVRAAHPDWHPVDVELKARATQRASRWAVEQTSAQNTVWDVRAEAAALSVPTHVIGADPAVYSIFTGALADEVLQNPLVTMSVVSDAGHSPHRDRPDETVAALLAALD
ncbi:alpha/beta hydrolase [Microbacterium sp.]|uniref:alpha/beta fold hydrolase n=1 Tax=Microbacterium sp. TaxID=51671 RepID=UPI0025D80C83|nr:alpha/beta hydrolase [Microbacterium sp.]MBT9605701.1 alpha/beta hydrolase [Microbacterium sp.]